jgi:hypothetical protein
MTPSSGLKSASALPTDELTNELAKRLFAELAQGYVVPQPELPLTRPEQPVRRRRYSTFFAAQLRRYAKGKGKQGYKSLCLVVPPEMSVTGYKNLPAQDAPAVTIVSVQTSEFNELRAFVRTAVTDVIGTNDMLIRDLDPAIIPMLDTITDAIKNARDKVSESNIGTLVELLLASNDPAATIRAKIDAENADARIRFMENVPCLTSALLAEQLGHGAKNKSQTASRWKTERKAFSVPWRGREEYPAFQFRDGRPLPVIADVLAALPGGMTPWQIAFWFVSSNPWLDGKAPYTMLSDTDAIVRAAKQEDKVIVG